MSHNFTPYAVKNEFVRVENDSVFFDKVPNGNYVACGHDINDRRFNRHYEINSRIDNKSVWAMWNDFCGRWGLKTIWFIDENNRRHLIYREY